MTRLGIDRQKKKHKQGQTKADSPPLNIKEKLALKKEERQKKQKLTGLIVFAICVAILLGFPLSLLFDANIGAAVSLALILAKHESTRATLIPCLRFPPVRPW